MSDNGQLVTQQFGLLADVHGTPVGIDIPDFTDLNAFKEFCAGLAKLRSFSPFVVGDSFAKAVAQFGDKKAMSDTICGIADYNPKYIRTCSEVCGKVPRTVRRIGLSFEHHAAVSKVKGNGCDDHHDYPITNPAECFPCEEARLSEISLWLETAEKKKLSAKDLKDQIVASRTTDVRGHTRNLDGKDFPAEEFREAFDDVKTNLKILNESMKFAGMITKAKNLDRAKAQALLGKTKDLKESVENLEEFIGKWL